MVAALSQIAANRCQFIVGGRAKTTTVSTASTASIASAAAVSAAAVSAAAASTFETCSTIMQLPYGEVSGATAPAERTTEEAETVAEMLPRSVADMFVGLTEQQFRLDLSSTEIRNRASATADFTSASAVPLSVVDGAALGAEKAASNN